MKHTEHDLQVGCVRWFRLAYPSELIFAIPNGGARDAVTGAMLRAEGATRGIPDLMIAAKRAGYGGMFIEMKSAKGRLSVSQAQMIARLKELDYYCEVCRSFDEFTAAVRWYMSRIGG